MEKNKTKTGLGSKSDKELEAMSEKANKAFDERRKLAKTKTGLGSTSEKEQEIDDLLSEEEELEANYKRLEKQRMSDQGIVSPKELKEFGKDVYRGVKKKGKQAYDKLKKEGKDFAKGFKEGVKQPIKSIIKSIKGKDDK
jgi:hypothetical protein